MKHIKHDNLKYKIVGKDKSNDSNMGCILYKTGIIEIDKSMPKDIKQSVLFHECTHLVLANLGESELNNNECFVERLSNAMYRMIKTNKKLLVD